MISRFPQPDVQFVSVQWLVSRRSSVRVTKLPRTSRRRERKTPAVVVQPRFHPRSAQNFNPDGEARA
jgi:hypothetical protein